MFLSIVFPWCSVYATLSALVTQSYCFYLHLDGLYTPEAPSHHLAFGKGDRTYDVLAILLSLPELFRPGVDTKQPAHRHPKHHDTAYSKGFYLLGIALCGCGIGHIVFIENLHPAGKKGMFQLVGNGAMRLRYSVGAGGGCAGPCTRQANPGKHLGREKQGIGPQGEGSRDARDSGFGEVRVAVVPESVQAPVACCASCLGFQRTPRQACIVWLPSIA